MLPSKKIALALLSSSEEELGKIGAGFLLISKLVFNLLFKLGAKSLSK